MPFRTGLGKAAPKPCVPLPTAETRPQVYSRAAGERGATERAGPGRSGGVNSLTRPRRHIPPSFPPDSCLEPQGRSWRGWVLRAGWWWWWRRLVSSLFFSSREPARLTANVAACGIKYFAKVHDSCWFKRPSDRLESFLRLKAFRRWLCLAFLCLYLAKGESVATRVSGLPRVPTRNRVADTNGKSHLPILAFVFIFRGALQDAVKSARSSAFSDALRVSRHCKTRRFLVQREPRQRAACGGCAPGGMLAAPGRSGLRVRAVCN